MHSILKVFSDSKPHNLRFDTIDVKIYHVVFDVSFECDICHPVEGQLIKCQVQNITRAGIKAVYVKEKKSPIIVFIARDHHYSNEGFNKLKENDNITIKVIGIRYELNDEFISIIADLDDRKVKRPKITINN